MRLKNVRTVEIQLTKFNLRQLTKYDQRERQNGRNIVNDS